MTIMCAFKARIKTIDAKTSKEGKPYTLLLVEVDADETQTQHVAYFRGGEKLAEQVTDGDMVLIKGTLKVKSWTGADGKDRTALAITAIDIDPIFPAKPAKPNEALANKPNEALVKQSLSHPAVKTATNVFPKAKVTAVNTQQGRFTPGPVGTELNDSIADMFPG